MSGQTMLGWGDPEEERKMTSSVWLHCPARGKLRLCILSKRPVRYVGHWVNGRMLHCDGDRCLYCERRMGSQTRYCFAVLDLDTRTSASFEVGAGAAEQMLRHVNVVGTLRGACFLFSKERGRERGRLLAQPIPGVIPDDGIPPEWDVQAMLERAWAEPSVADRIAYGL